MKGTAAERDRMSDSMSFPSEGVVMM